VKTIDDNILTTLRDYYLLAAADLALYPEGSPEHIQAEHSAANTSRTVFELFGAKAAEDLRKEAVKKWPRLEKGA
jgi:hypothetical protein